VRTPWWSKRAIGLHATLAICLPGFLALGYWQLHRALGGNGLSWAYTFEWPLFAIYSVFLWWRLIHEPAEDSTSLSNSSAGNRRSSPKAVEREARAAADLESYNAYLASLQRAEPTPNRSQE
jgi:hypothetical protein